MKLHGDDIGRVRAEREQYRDAWLRRGRMINGTGEFAEDGPLIPANEVRRLADAIERDRREPDKVLCHLQTLRRVALQAEVLADLWCPVCKRYHDGEIGEKTDAGVITRACPRVPTNDPRYYPSPLYTGDRG